MKLRTARLFIFFSSSICMADAVDHLLNEYTRPFTLLAVGQDVGQIILAKAPIHPESTFAILEEAPGSENSLTSHKNVLWMNHQLLLSELKDLASCEHVDVLLLYNSMPTYGSNWKKALHLFQQMSHRVIVQLLKDENTYFEEHKEYLEEIHAYLSEHSAKTFNDGPLISYILENKNPFHLEKTSLIHPKKTRRKFEIYCDYKEKYLKKIRPDWTDTTPWFPGLNMLTFLIFNGTIPSRPQILANLPLDPDHRDWVANNMIMQGTHIFLIDKNDPLNNGYVFDDGEQFRSMEAGLRTFISSTLNLAPIEVRERFISIFGWRSYFEQTEIDE